MFNAWAIGGVFGYQEELLAFLPQPIVGVIVAIERITKDEDKQLGNKENYGLNY